MVGRGSAVDGDGATHTATESVSVWCMQQKERVSFRVRVIEKETEE